MSHTREYGSQTYKKLQSSATFNFTCKVFSGAQQSYEPSLYTARRGNRNLLACNKIGAQLFQRSVAFENKLQFKCN